MKLKFIALGFASVLLLGALLFVNNHRRQQMPAYLLRQYPRSDMLRMIIADHTKPPIPLAIAVFFTNWFDSDATDPSTGCNVTTAGTSCGIWSVNGMQSKPSANPSPARYAKFDKIAPTLPPSQPNPPLRNLLIVSFKRNGKWTTRIYDRSDLPASVVKAHRILGVTGFDKPAKQF